MTELEKLKATLDQAQKDVEEAFKVYDEKRRACRVANAYYEKELYKDCSCRNCRYYSIHDSSFDGWHNVCGAEDAPCTCCNSLCDKFKIDNCITTWLKAKNIYLSPYQAKALAMLYTDIMAIDDKSLTDIDKHKRDLYVQIINTIKIKKGLDIDE